MLLVPGKSATAQDSAVPNFRQKLQANIETAQVVALGEEGHGYETYNQAKTKILSFLRSKMGYRKLVVESSFTECIISYLTSGSLEQRLQHFIYPFWNTRSVRDGLQPLYEEEKRTGEPSIFGCDIQEDCRYVSLASYLLSNGLVKENKDQLLSCDSLLAYYIGEKPGRQYPSLQEYQLLLSYYKDVQTEIASNQQLSGPQQKLLLRSMENRQWLCHYLTIKSGKERMHFRDSLMAENVNWLRKELSGSPTFILWTTNLHAAAAKADSSPPQWLGERLSRLLGKNYYPIAFEKKKTFSSKHYSLDDECSIAFDSDSSPFSATVYCNKLVKIAKEEWITPCE